MQTDSEKKYKRAINCWSLYDFANSAFATTIMVAIFPPFYHALVVKAGFSQLTGTVYWAYTTCLSLLFIAILGPVLGALSDHTGGKKKYIAVFTGIGVAATAAALCIGEKDYLLASLIFIIGNIGFAGANIFYDSLLPHIALPSDIDRVSSRGFAIGYIGGGILLCINVLWILYPSFFGLSGSGAAVRLSFLSVAVWWLFFSIPLFVGVPEPLLPHLRKESVSAVRGTLHRLRRTVRRLGNYRQLLLFLIAFWFYNDGIGTIMKMATVYGAERGIGINHMITALIITQFIGVPSTFAFGRVASKLGSKMSILAGIGFYILITIAGYFMKSPVHFYMLAAGVGLVQGGTQALSRSLYGSMIPKTQSAEFYGFMSTSSKMAGVVGPLVFGIVSQSFSNSRLGVLSVMAFFFIGGAILLLVDEEKGRQIAKREDEIISKSAELHGEHTLY